jgi:pimeloyl-ACP methyl ester carboxylesterase
MKLFFQKYPKNREETVVKSTVTPTLIFLHGMGGTGQIWRPIAAHFEDRYSVICPDQRGHGKSTLTNAVNQPFTPEAFAEDIFETFFSTDATEKISTPAWIIGHSMGSRTAAAFAGLYPQWVSGLVLIDLGLTGAAGGGIGEILSLFLEKLPPTFPTRGEARDFLALHCPDPSIAQYLLAVSPINLKSGELTFPFQREALLRTIHQALHRETAPDVRKFSLSTGRPVKVLHGATSRVYETDAYLRDQASFQDLENVEFKEFSGTGHGLPFEKRSEFNQCLDEWLTHS